ncbi:hypothetical protein [Pseudonocardia phyllosphaerae]|uniref:hypothetical protein n=1 Tax=Pseudonocardia phyllosphaerae TaxID=3390502 RepID=UPI003978B5E3
MTAAAVPAAPSTAVPNRLVAVARMTNVDLGRRMGLVWGVLSVIFVVNVAIFWVVRTVELRSSPGAEAGGGTGAVTALLIIVGASYLAMMTQVLPFALSLGLTRRDFYTGVALVMVAETFVHALLVTILVNIEFATGGWGIRMKFFSAGIVPDSNPALQFACYWVPLLTFGFLFLAIGTVFRRWGQYGVWTVLVTLTLVLGGLAVLITWQGGWPAFGRFFVETPRGLLLATYPLVVAVVAAAGGYLLVRRARP